MQRTYNTKIINRSKNSNGLYIRLINPCPNPNTIALVIYDYTNCTPQIAYNTTLYLNAKSIKALTFPLVSQNYDDCLNIKIYRISYTTPNHFIQLSYKELFIN